MIPEETTGWVMMYPEDTGAEEKRRESCEINVGVPVGVWVRGRGLLCPVYTERAFPER